MAAKFLFFAQSSDWMKLKRLDIILKEPIQLLELINNTNELKPIKEYINCLKVSINHSIVNINSTIKDGDEVAFLPPFSGG